MATRFPETKQPMQTFIEVEQLIRSTFDRIIGTATERRDQLLVQLNDMRLEYLNKEETRKKQVSDIQKLISQLMEASIQQNPIVRLQEKQIESLGEERKKYETPTPVPVPSFRTEGLESLLEQLRGLGPVHDVGAHYREKINPIRQFGRAGGKKGELNCPSGIALYRNESIYIVDTDNQRIQIFSTAGEFLSEFGKGQLSYPYSIALYDKWVFVGDLGSPWTAVCKFLISNNKFICQSARDVLGDPNGITVDTDGEVLVADYNNNRIAVLNLELELVREIGKGKLKFPRDVKVNNNNIIVADNSEINNIHIFTKSGDNIRSFIKLDKGTGYVYFCLDLNNNIIVSDFIKKSIQIFTIAGELIHKIVCESNPAGIVVDNNNNIICACENGIVCIY